MLNLEEIQLRMGDLNQAVDIEKQHRFINLRGRKKRFSDFMQETLKGFSFLDLDDNPELNKLLERFKQYEHMDLGQRMTTIELLDDSIRRGWLRSILQQGQQLGAAKQKVLSKENTTSLDEMDVKYVKGVGPKFATVLNTVGIFTVEDLLYYFPRKYLDYNNRLKISELTEGMDTTVIGTVHSVAAYNAKSRNLSVVTVTITDGTGMMNASWFYGKSNQRQLESYKSRFKKGSEVMMSGKVKWDKYKRKYAMDRAVTEILSYADGEENKGSDSLHAGRIVPVYALTEGLNLRSLRKAIHNALQEYLGQIVDPMPENLIKNNRLIGLHQALEQIHFPESQEQYQAARRRLVFDEFFYLQCRLSLMRQEYKFQAKGLQLNKKDDGLVSQFIRELPFNLTGAQQRCLSELFGDLSESDPMYRMLQGDVGSGKTVVALITMLVAIENGYQAALMAPTEILAEQHYRKFQEWLVPFGLRVGLFVGKSGAKERRELQQALYNGQIHLAVGTHALIQDKVEFNNLGVVVIDEQHRFGVRQRTLLKEKGEHPEMLTMTATPIPRSLAMTVHGDLDVSLLDERPPGRTPIKTVLMTSNKRDGAYQLIKGEILKGRQAYIVFPLIEESETLSAKAATTEAKRLQEEVFQESRIGLLHGKLKPDEKDEVMGQFLRKEIDILVSTTVVEVGVDVPNATVMVIENADRFGLSQLHQLRGRVGRSTYQSYCVLVSDSKTQDTMHRLGIMVETEDGFKIAEHDLEIRGPGEFLGTRQSGLPDFMLADLVHDQDILQLARQSAQDVTTPPDKLDENPTLKQMILQKTEETFSVLGSG